MNPITLTDAAVTHIKSMMDKDHGAIGFRLSIKKTGCSGFAYVPNIVSKKVEYDLEFEVQNKLQVFLDPKALEFIDELLIDFIVEEGHGLKQKRLVFINPKEKGRCGCGESFTIE